MVEFKIQNPTVTEGESLCRSCRYVHMQRGYRDTDEAIFCDYGRRMRQVRFAVHSCTDYADRGHPTRWDMEQIAWILVKPRGGGPMGFRAPGLDDDEDED